MFGLLNANARLYSPYLGRFVSPDPLLNSEGGALDYNPYIYARNNPYKYIDRNGEIGALAVLGIGFLIGGTINVVCNWNNIHSWSEGFMFFGVGGVAGFAGAAVAVMAPAGFFAGALYGAIGGGLSGSILGGGNALLLGLDVGSAMFAGAWQGAVTGFVLGGFTGGANAKAKGLKYWSGNEKIPSVSANPAANVSATPQSSAVKSTSPKDINSSSGSSSPETLIHYTNKEGYQKILETGELNPSIGIKNARYGEGQYFTNLEPKDYTAGQVSRRLYGVPWNTSKLQYYIKIDMTGLNPIQNNPHNFLVPGNNPLPLHGRIVDSGISLFKIRF